MRSAFPHRFLGSLKKSRLQETQKSMGKRNAQHVSSRDISPQRLNIHRNRAERICKNSIRKSVTFAVLDFEKKRNGKSTEGAGKRSHFVRVINVERVYTCTSFFSPPPFSSAHGGSVCTHERHCALFAFLCFARSSFVVSNVDVYGIASAIREEEKSR